MDTVDDILGSLQRAPRQAAPSWRVRITFTDGSEWEDMYDPAAAWPAPLAALAHARGKTRERARDGRIRQPHAQLALQPPIADAP